MAIFYKEIKGCGSDITSSGEGLWTFIRWSGYSPTMAAADRMPSVVTRINKTGTEVNSGPLIARNVAGQYIAEPFRFAASLEVAQTLTAGQFNIGDAIFTETALSVPADWSIKYGDASAISLDADGVHIKNTLHTDGDIIAEGKVEGSFMNVRSDARAKEKIRPVEIHGLDILENLDLYRFEYIGQGIPTIGAIAQEVAEVTIDGDIKLVDNECATGQDGDFMSIRENRLMYVLLDAIKELSQKVKELEAQLKGE